MMENLDAVRELRRRAQELTAACAVAALVRVYHNVIAEGVPGDMADLLKRPDERTRRRTPN